MQNQNDQRPKRSAACNYCRLKKIKCDGGNPCPNCVDRGKVCVYVAFKGRTSRAKTDTDITRHDALSDASTLSDPTRQPPRMWQWPAPTNDQAVRSPLFPTTCAPQSQPIATDRLNPDIVLPSAVLSGPRDLEPSTSAIADTHDHSGGSLPPLDDETNLDYHGPGSFMSFCSDACVTWVCEKTGVSDFAAIARQLTQDISEHLRVDEGTFSERQPEPDQSTAWKYVKAYFDESRDTVFGIISRPVFESRLRAYLAHDLDRSLSKDYSWYALRNAVYAAGCRQLLSREKPGPFLIGKGHGWEYFQNALSVHTALIYSRTDLMAVQALAIMAQFAESVASPAIDYTLSVSAMKMAEAKGLHRQPNISANQTESTLQSQRYLWWSIYSSERLNALIWGRPLSVDDKAITCELPSKVVEGSTVKLELLLSWIKHAQVSGNITERLTALRESSPPLNDVLRTVVELEHAVYAWHASLPLALRSDVGHSHMQEPVDPAHLLEIHSRSLQSLLTIHSILCHPWNAPAIQMEPEDLPEFEKYSAKSMHTIVEASRQIINKLRYINVDVCCPKRLVFITPLTALMNIFFYILQYPTLLTVHSDLDRMYQVCGHFSYLEYMCPIKFSLPREVTNLARSVVARAKAGTSAQQPTLPAYTRPITASDTFSLPHGGLVTLEDESWTEMLNFDNDVWDAIRPGPVGGSDFVATAGYQSYE